MSKQETLKNQILIESIKILGQQGFAGLSLREVAKKLNVTHQAPYHYFPDKESLLLELKKMGFAQLSAAMERALEKISDPFEKMEALGMTYFDFCVENPGYFRAMFAPTASGEGVRVAEAQHAFSLVLDCIQQLQIDGHLQKYNPDVIAMVCWTSMHGMVSLVMDKYPIVGGKYDTRDLAKKMLLTLHELYGRR